MKNDYEVKLYMSERPKGISQKVAAARAGMSERTARKYELAGKLPSELKRPHDRQTRQICLRKIGSGLSSNSNAILRSNLQCCLRCCVSSILIGIIQRRIRQLSEEVDLAYDLVQPFAKMLRTRTGEKLDDRLTQAQASQTSEWRRGAAR